MTENFVLVHGAWHGGWAWQPVASRLRAAGDVALPPGGVRLEPLHRADQSLPVSVPGSHASMFTRPAELADAFGQIATAR